MAPGGTVCCRTGTKLALLPDLKQLVLLEGGRMVLFLVVNYLFSLKDGYGMDIQCTNERMIISMERLETFIKTTKNHAMNERTKEIRCPRRTCKNH